MASSQQKQPTQQQPTTPTSPSFSDLPAEWQTAISALVVGSQQLVIRLAALEKSGQIGPEGAKGYADWAKRVQSALARFPQEQ